MMRLTCEILFGVIAANPGMSRPQIMACVRELVPGVTVSGVDSTLVSMEYNGYLVALDGDGAYWPWRNLNTGEDYPLYEEAIA